MDVFEVAIVGAGAHGASVAFHLASRHVRTVIFDKGGPASGPTGRSSAIVRALYTNEVLASAAQASIQIFRNFQEVTHGRDAGFKETGWLFLYGPDTSRRVPATAATLNRLGIPIDTFDLTDLDRQFPDFDLTGVACALWERGAGYADPVATTQGLLSRAVELGAVSRLYTAVVGISTTHKKIVVTTEDGSSIQCRRLLIAAGPWTAGLAKLVGAELPLTVERHVVATIQWAEAARMPFGHTDLTGNYYCKPEGDYLYCLGPLLPGELVHPDRFDQNLSPDEGARLVGSAVRRVPVFSDAQLTGGWASVYDVSPDWQPVIGEIAEGVFVDAGTSGHGFKLAPALGAMVADLLVEPARESPLLEFHPGRFNEGVFLSAGFGEAKILG